MNTKYAALPHQVSDIGRWAVGLGIAPLLQAAEFKPGSFNIYRIRHKKDPEDSL